MLFPRSKKLMIFGAWWGKRYDDNSRYLYEYTVANRTTIKAIWMTADRLIYDSLKSQNMPVCFANSFKAYWYALRAKNVVTVTSREDIGKNLVPFTGRMRQIQLWHGVPLKKIMYDDEYNGMSNLTKFQRIRKKILDFPKRNYYVGCTSEFFHKQFVHTFRLPYNHILNFGYARNDYFFGEHTNTYRQRYVGKKIILYMPTHRMQGKETMNMNEILDLEAINDLCMQNKAVFLIKKHFYHSSESQIPNNEYTNVFEITQENPSVQELLEASDIFITDYSSCYIDHLFLDRPQIFFAYDLKRYMSQDRGFYFEYKQETMPGKICYNTQQLQEELNQLLLGVDSFAEKRKSIKDFFYDIDNQNVVAGKQIDTIVSLDK